MLTDLHKRKLEYLDKLIDPEHVEATERLQEQLYQGQKLEKVPCVMGMADFEEWPKYGFSETWDDHEKNLINALRSVCWGAMIKDDRLYNLRAEYGVVNVAEALGIESIITDQGNSMSEGVNDIEKIRAIIDAGVPSFDDSHSKKVKRQYDFAREVLGEYENLSRFVHFTLPDTQGPYDLACLVWGSGILTAQYEYPELLEELMCFMTETFIAYNRHFKDYIDEPMDMGYHIVGLKLVKGGVRICDDSATLLSPDFYSQYIAGYNTRAFEPFSGGWLHYCGNGNHLLEQMLNIKGVNYLHLGNPDYHDFFKIAELISSKGVVLFWSGNLEEINRAMEITDNRRILVLVENRYAPADIEDAKIRLERVREGKSIAAAQW